MSKVEAGRLGARARLRQHGNPGTKAGRRKGGLNSLLTHNKRNTGFKIRKSIRIPKYSDRLAEFIGIVLGDGHVGLYQTSITTNSKTDLEHAQYIQSLIKELFKIKSTLSYKKNSDACTVTISSRNLCLFLGSNGLTGGNKIRDGVFIPDWIQKNKMYARECVRGLFDTDGCVYKDKHTVKGKEYASLCIAFTNASIPILNFVEKTLKNEGVASTRWGRHIRIRRAKDVCMYLQKIGFSNPKHLKKITI